MPLLRETERSVRLYFVVGGIFWLVTGIRAVSDLAVVLQLPVRYAIAGSVPIALHIALGVVLLVAAVVLPSALRTGAVWIQRMLVATALLLLFEGALLHWISPWAAESLVLPTAVSIAFVVYLGFNVRRLSGERRARESLVPAPPAARIVPG